MTEIQALEIAIVATGQAIPFYDAPSAEAEALVVLQEMLDRLMAEQDQKK